jgi:2-oxoglutarate dehydrogenase E2 component (dihydrolipoamide succinyltransferase)
MAIEMKVPTLGESISEVTIASWLKQDGDYVKMDEVLCEVETDKATMELNAEQAGILTIIAQAGDTLSIGDVICKIDTEGAAPSADAPKKAPSTEEEKAPAKAGAL